MRMGSLGRVVFAVTLIGLGVLGLVQGGFTPIWSGVPPTLPAREVLAYACALVSLGAGAGLLWRRTAATAAGALLIVLVGWLVLFRLPALLRAPFTTGTWWACGQTAVLIAAAWVLRVQLARARSGEAAAGAAGGARDAGLSLARMLYGLALIPFGVAHFTYLQRTVSMVPRWLPWHLGWAYITGAAFVAAGLGVLSGVYARLAATLSAVEMGLFTLVVWLPVVATGPSAYDRIESVVSWALTAAAWVVADSYRGVPWLAVRRVTEGPSGEIGAAVQP